MLRYLTFALISIFLATLVLVVPNKVSAVESVYEYTLTLTAGGEVKDGQIEVGKSTTVTATLKDKTGKAVAATKGSWSLTLSGKGTLSSVTVASDNKSASATFTASSTSGDKATIKAQAKKSGKTFSASLEITTASKAEAAVPTEEIETPEIPEAVTPTPTPTVPTGGVISTLVAFFQTTGLWLWILIIALLLILFVAMKIRKKGEGKGKETV